MRHARRDGRQFFGRDDGSVGLARLAGGAAHRAAVGRPRPASCAVGWNRVCGPHGISTISRSWPGYSGSTGSRGWPSRPDHRRRSTPETRKPRGRGDHHHIRFDGDAMPALVIRGDSVARSGIPQRHRVSQFEMQGGGRPAHRAPAQVGHQKDSAESPWVRWHSRPLTRRPSRQNERRHAGRHDPSRRSHLRFQTAQHLVYWRLEQLCTAVRSFESHRCCRVPR